jgi:hypothetical protein
MPFDIEFFVTRKKPLALLELPRKFLLPLAMI